MDLHAEDRRERITGRGGADQASVTGGRGPCHSLSVFVLMQISWILMQISWMMRTSHGRCGTVLVVLLG
ncbi:MAG: hypothetical protein OXC06_04355 [Acidimicrobiaceae bacterium]|nr:hypothetical protein [Acidimicrobiaceae bacterium]